MRRKLAAIFALLLTLALLFTACAPAAPATPTDYADEPEETFDLVVVTDEPTDETPADAHETSPPETDAPTEIETELHLQEGRPGSGLERRQPGALRPGQVHRGQPVQQLRGPAARKARPHLYGMRY